MSSKKIGKIRNSQIFEDMPFMTRARRQSFCYRVGNWKANQPEPEHLFCCHVSAGGYSWEEFCREEKTYKGASFEYVLDNVCPEYQEEFLFHLNVLSIYRGGIK